MTSSATDSPKLGTAAALLVGALLAPLAAQDEPRLAFSGARLVLGWLDSRDAAVGLRVNHD